MDSVYGNAMKRGGFILMLGMSVVAFAARAQTSDPNYTGQNYDIKNMNFDMWCQEQQHLDPDRCDKRLPEDEAAFEAYRSKIEQYELPYLQERNKQQDYDRNLLHNDPVDHPTEPSTPPMQPINSAPPK